jgi:hypothetical protein
VIICMYMPLTFDIDAYASPDSLKAAEFRLWLREEKGKVRDHMKGLLRRRYGLTRDI